MAIEFVYFDVGQVFVSFDEGLKTLFAKYHVPKKLQQEVVNLLFKYTDKLCLNMSHLSDIKELLQTKFGKIFDPLFDNDFDFVNITVDNWQAISPMHQFAEKVSKKYQIGLLSNAYSGMIDRGLELGKIPRLPYASIVDSSVVQLIKPDKKIYELAVVQAGAPKESILFIDDMQRNIESAQEYGLQTFLFDYKQSSSQIDQLAQMLDID